FVAVTDLDTGRTQDANARHPPALLCDGRVGTELEPTGPIISGFLRGWATSSTPIGRGQTLLSYTDGVAQARDQHRQFFGSGPLERVLTDGQSDSADDVVTRCRGALEEFAREGLRDDATLVALQRG